MVNVRQMNILIIVGLLIASSETIGLPVSGNKIWLQFKIWSCDMPHLDVHVTWAHYFVGKDEIPLEQLKIFRYKDLDQNGTPH